jgi:hypothetical protein
MLFLAVPQVTLSSGCFASLKFLSHDSWNYPKLKDSPFHLCGASCTAARILIASLSACCLTTTENDFRTRNLTRLVLWCIEAKFCKKICVGKLSPRCTQCTPLHRSLSSIFSLKIAENVADFSNNFFQKLSGFCWILKSIFAKLWSIFFEIFPKCSIFLKIEQSSICCSKSLKI